MTKENKTEDWREEFDRRWAGHSDGLFTGEAAGSEELRDEIKHFITNLLETQKEQLRHDYEILVDTVKDECKKELRERIKGMRISDGNEFDSSPFSLRHPTYKEKRSGYNQALSVLLKNLK